MYRHTSYLLLLVTLLGVSGQTSAQSPNVGSLMTCESYVSPDADTRNLSNMVLGSYLAGRVGQSAVTCAILKLGTPERTTADDSSAIKASGIWASVMCERADKLEAGMAYIIKGQGSEKLKALCKSELGRNLPSAADQVIEGY